MKDFLFIIFLLVLLIGVQDDHSATYRSVWRWIQKWRTNHSKPK